MRIFITGASGFIGSWVTRELHEAGHDLTLLVRNPEKVPALQELPRTKVIYGSLDDREMIAEYLKGQDACVHIALYWGDTPLEMLEKDTAATVFLLEESEKHNLKHFLYTSSTEALGEINSYMTEDMACRPHNLYGATKAAAESYVLAYGQQSSGLHCNVIRPGYTFGNPAFPGAHSQPDQRFHELVQNIRNDLDVKLIQYDGTQFIWAGDLAKVYRKVLESNLRGNIYHGLSADFVSWERIAEETIERIDSRSHIILEDLGWGEEPCLFSVEAIERDFKLRFHPHQHILEHIDHLLELKE
jgi:UDP-glucose 4-epimerase